MGEKRLEGPPPGADGTDSGTLVETKVETATDEQYRHSRSRCTHLKDRDETQHVQTHSFQICSNGVLGIKYEFAYCPHHSPTQAAGLFGFASCMSM